MSTVEDLKWKKFPVLDDGFVCLVDVMGDDADIVQAAQVSYGNDVRGDADLSEDVALKNRKLMRFMMRHRHSSPFEMAELKFLVRVPMDTWRQWIRHRTANVNEYSTRYTPAIDSMAVTGCDSWRLQATSNKQGSSGSLVDWPEGWTSTEEGTKWVIDGPDDRKWTYQKNAHDFTAPLTPGQFLTLRESLNQSYLTTDYSIRLELGVAREQARKDLPLSTYTEAYWKIDLSNLLHFLGLRMDSHAQQEIREYATIIGEQIVAVLFPQTWEAFRDYRSGALTLTRIEKALIGHLAMINTLPASRQFLNDFVFPELAPVEWLDANCRERDEFFDKLDQLNFLI